MKIRFWGVRGSLPTPLSNETLGEKIESALRLGIKEGLQSEEEVPAFMDRLPWPVKNTAGGNTSCLQIEAEGEVIICDGGTGLRPLGLHLMGASKGAPLKGHILLSHTHWDHICGIPFFVPAYIPHNRITLHGAYSDLEERIRGQQESRYFPVPLMGSINFHSFETGESFRVGEVEIETRQLNHPGGSCGYKIKSRGKSVVYATDSEYKDLDNEVLMPVIDFFRGAHILVFDAQYTMLENVEKEDWGHSNTMTGIDMALEAGVKKIVFTHHEPTYGDQRLWEILEKAREYLELHGETDLELHLAYEGLEIDC